MRSREVYSSTVRLNRIDKFFNPKKSVMSVCNLNGKAENGPNSISMENKMSAQRVKVHQQNLWQI